MAVPQKVSAMSALAAASCTHLYGIGAASAYGKVPFDVTFLAALGGAPLASPTFTGAPLAPTASAGTNTTQLASTAFVTAAIAAAMSNRQSAFVYFA